MTLTIEGDAERQHEFLEALRRQPPTFADIKSLVIERQPLAHFDDFRIRASSADGGPSVFVLPDIATCPACVHDIFNPASRYYQYPFTSCCHCGSRYSIMAAQPYDRGRTTMAAFTTCHECEREYRSIGNRRFHAQTIACPACGPRLSLHDESGALLAEKQHALTIALQQLRAGRIVAVKGLGGYQLLVDAGNQAAVERLRQRKHRRHKPFALMVADLAAAQKLCFINRQEEAALTSPAAPIVLLARRDDGEIAGTVADAVAPDHGLLGVMLAYTPLHHLLLSAFGAPVVATSGNRGNETICITEQQARTQLAGIADYFLSHDRAILRPLDDSVVRLINGKITVLRRARGYAPLPVTLPAAMPETLAVGGQLKNTLAISHGRQVILSQHLGDLDAETTRQQFQITLADVQDFYRIKPARILHDLHQGYASSQFAARLARAAEPAVTVSAVQHHHAHALACMAEHGLRPPALSMVWDGSGLGADGTLWGGEFLLINRDGFQRYARFRDFPLPGGAKAIQEPRRVALGLLHELHADRAAMAQDLGFSRQELTLLLAALNRQLNCPRTSSAGRLFDAVASLLGLCQINHYEGQAAMALEHYAASAAATEHYQFQVGGSMPAVIDWQPMFEQILEDRRHGPPELIARKFHNTLAEIMLAVALQAGQEAVVLSGGCFQNACLVETAARKLTAAGFAVYCHENIPPNDGGLALGQLYAAYFTG